MENPPIKGKCGQYKYFNILKNPNEFLQKATNIYGATGNGKSVLANNILYSIRKLVFIMIAYSTTSESDDAFPMSKYTSKVFINDHLDTKSIKNIIEKNQKKKEAVKKLQDPKMLRDTVKYFVLPVYMEHSPKEYKKNLKAYRLIQKINAKFESNKTIDNDSLRKHNKEMFRMYKVILYKFKIFLKENRKYINCKSLYENYKDYYITMYLHDLNTKVVMYYNDVGDDVKNLQGQDKSTFKALYTRARHADISIIFLAQSINQLGKEERMGAKINIFVDSASITDYCNLGRITGTVKKRLLDAADCIINADRNSDKKRFLSVMHHVESGEIYYIRADNTIRPKYVGNKKLYSELQKLCGKTENITISEMLAI